MKLQSTLLTLSILWSLFGAPAARAGTLDGGNGPLWQICDAEHEEALRKQAKEPGQPRVRCIPVTQDSGDLPYGRDEAPVQ